MKLLAKEHHMIMKMKSSVIFEGKKFKIKISKIKNIVKFAIMVIIQENIEMLRIAYVI